MKYSKLILIKTYYYWRCLIYVWCYVSNIRYVDCDSTLVQNFGPRISLIDMCG